MTIVLLVLALVGLMVFALLSDHQPGAVDRRPPAQPRQQDDQAAAYAAYGEGERAGREAAEREAAEWRIANDPGETGDD